MQFVPSATRPDDVERIARLQYESWSHLYPTWPFEKYVTDLLNNRWTTGVAEDMRFAWFAVDENDRALGVAMLVANGEVEASDEADLPGPWFAGLVVEPSARSKGIGGALLDHVKASARAMGFERLRLVTESKADFYERRGWAVERVVHLNSIPNTVMFTTLTP